MISIVSYFEYIVFYDRLKILIVIDIIKIIPFIYKGEYAEPQQDWLRVGATVILLSGMVIGTAYSGVLVAVLSTPTTMPAIETLDDLASQKDLLWTVQRGTSLVDLFVVHFDLNSRVITYI